MSEDRELDEARSGLPELTKKILSLGLGAYFLTEDAIRRAVKDAKIPRDIGKSIAQNASKGKEELFGYVARELSGFLRQMNVQQELDRFAQTHKIRVTAEIEFVPRDGGAPPPAPEVGTEEDETPAAPRRARDSGSGLGRAIDLNVALGKKGAPEPSADEEDE